MQIDKKQTGKFYIFRSQSALKQILKNASR